MKKQKKQLIMIAVVFAILLIVYLIVRNREFSSELETDASAASEDISVCTFETADITAVTYDVDGENYTYVTEDGRWVCKEEPGTAIDTDKMERMLNTLTALKASEKVEAEDQSGFGFDTPEKTIEVTTSSGTHSFVIGGYNEFVSQYYLSENGENVYLIDSTLDTAFSKMPSDLAVEETEEEDTEEEAAAE